MTGTHSSEDKNANNVILRLISGDCGLAMTLWGFKGLGELIILFLLTVLSEIVGLFLLKILIIGILIYRVVVAIGIWKAAGKYNGDSSRVYFAKLFVVVDVFFIGKTVITVVPLLMQI